MLATTTDVAPDSDLENHALVYEPKYDGIRALVALEPGATHRRACRSGRASATRRPRSFPRSCAA